MIIRRGRIPWLLVATVIVLAGMVPVPGNALPPGLTYRVMAQYRDPAGNIVETSQETPLLVPSLLDVDHDLGTGVAGLDILVHVQLGPGTATVRAIQLLPVEAPALQPPDPMPLRLEVILSDPRPGSPLRLGLGYDALADTAPVTFEAAFGVAGAGRGSTFSLDLATVRPGASIGVTAELFEPGPAGERLNPKRGRLDFSPVPGSAHLALVTSAEPGTEALRADFALDAPSLTTLTLQDIEGTDESALTATVDRMPNALSVALARDATGRQSADYSASAPVDHLSLLLAESAGGTVLREAALDVEDMPRRASFVQDTPTHATFQSEAPIGRIDVGLSSGGPIRRLPDANAYLYSDDVGGARSFALRLFGLEAFEMSTADPVLFDATLGAGPMHVVQRRGAASLDAWIRDVPHQIRVSFSQSAGTLTYNGSAVVGEITLDMADPAGISGRADELHLVLRDLPTSLELSLSSTGGSVSLDAHGQTLGSIEVLLTSGPDQRLDPSVDGILLRDLADRYVVFGRITGLRRAVVAQGPPPDVLIETTGGRIFRLDLETLKGTKIEYVRATLDRLVPSVRIQLVETTRSQELIYTASAPTAGIVLDTNSGDRWNLNASIAPLPASFRFCASSDATCTGSSSARAGAFSFTASEHTTVSLFDCVRPLNATCTRAGSPTDFTRVDLRLRHLQADADFSDLGFSGRLFMNTTSGGVRHTMNGSLLSQSGSGGGFEANFPPGFWADNRRTDWTLFGLIRTKTGAVNCPPGTSLRVRVLGLLLDATGFLC